MSSLWPSSVMSNTEATSIWTSHLVAMKDADKAAGKKRAGAAFSAESRQGLRLRPRLRTLCNGHLMTVNLFARKTVPWLSLSQSFSKPLFMGAHRTLGGEKAWANPMSSTPSRLVHALPRAARSHTSGTGAPLWHTELRQLWRGG